MVGTFSATCRATGYPCFFLFLWVQWHVSNCLLAMFDLYFGFLISKLLEKVNESFIYIKKGSVTFLQ